MQLQKVTWAAEVIKLGVSVMWTDMVRDRVLVIDTAVGAEGADYDRGL